MGSAGRRTTPLFDLVADKPGATAKLAASTESASAANKPVVRIELQPGDRPSTPRAEAQSAGPATPPPHPEASGPDRAWAPNWLGGSMIRIPVNALSIGVALAIVLALVAWIMGVVTGQSRAERDLAQFGRQPPPITDPLSEPTSGGTPSNADRPRSPGPAVQRSESFGTLTSKGILDGDPREPGLNYLALAVLPADNAVAAIQFLSANGLEAFALPVDSGLPKANNPNPARTYRLYAFLGVSSEEYKRRATKVTNLEAEVARLGAVWQKQHRGASNFSRTQWEKYKE